MNTNELIEKLEALIKRHENDKYSAFDDRWVDILKACDDKIHELLDEIRRVNRILESREKTVEDLTNNDLDKEVEIAVMDMNYGG